MAIPAARLSLKEPKAKKFVHVTSGERPFAATDAGYMDRIGSPARSPPRGFLCVLYPPGMEISIADQAARKRGWRPSGRAAWLKSDGTMVCFICFEEQLAAVPAGARVHALGRRRA